jgi:hypothetical protein
MTPEQLLLLAAGFVILVLVIVIHCYRLDSDANWRLIEHLLKENMRLAYYTAEEAWRDANLDRQGNRLLTRAPDRDRVLAHLATGLPGNPRPRCPVCGVTGYRKAYGGCRQDTIFWCRRGHPHYQPTTTDPFGLEHI